MKTDLKPSDFSESTSVQPDSPLGMAREINEEVRNTPWGAGQVAGTMALFNTPAVDEQTGKALEPNEATESMLAKMPPHFRDYYKRKGDEALATMYSDSIRGMQLTLEDNQSPEVQSKVIDYKLITAHIVGELHKAGLLPGFDIEVFPEELDSLAVHFFSPLDATVPPHSAAFYDPDNDYVGILLGDNLTAPTFLHEATHARLEYRNPNRNSLFGSVCHPLREAVVQHITDRGLKFFSPQYAKSKGAPDKKVPYTSIEKRRGFNKAQFTKSDERHIYENERRILYELCGDGIGIEDFVQALMDPSGSSLENLRLKLNQEFTGLAGHGYTVDILTWVNDRIHGLAEHLNNEYPTESERAGYVLAKILDYKGKRAEAQASRARQEARRAYKSLRRTAVLAHANYFS